MRITIFDYHIQVKKLFCIEKNSNNKCLLNRHTPSRLLALRFGEKIMVLLNLTQSTRLENIYLISINKYRRKYC